MASNTKYPNIELQKNVLLIQTAFIGDVVLTTPMISAFKKKLPNSQLSVLVKPEAKSILQNNPDVHEILVIDKKNKHKGFRGMLAMAKEIRNKHFDILLCPHKSHRTSLLAIQSKIPFRVGYRIAGFSKIAYHKRLERDTSIPEIKRLLKFLDDALGCNTSDFPDQLRIFIDKQASSQATKLLQEYNSLFPILVAPSSVWDTKKWTATGFADLCRLLIKKYNKNILLIGAPTDNHVAQEVLSILQKTQSKKDLQMIHNICGKTNLPTLYAIMEKSSLLVSNDSAPVHFACAANLPVVAIFGPTTPSLGYAPIAKNSIIAQLENLDCRPCGTHGSHHCPQKHFKCMKELSADMVMEKINSVFP